MKKLLLTLFVLITIVIAGIYIFIPSKIKKSDETAQCDINRNLKFDNVLAFKMSSYETENGKSAGMVNSRYGLYCIIMLLVLNCLDD